MIRFGCSLVFRATRNCGFAAINGVSINFMNFLCIDTEDDSKELIESGKSGFDKRVTQIAAKTASGNTFYNKGNVKEFLKWLKQSKERFIYAHNLQYDLGNLFADELDELDVTMVGGRIIKAGWGNKVFVDSFNIWPMSAKKLGKAFGLEKLDTDNMATDKEYVFRDVEIIRQAMLFAWQFCEVLGMNHLPPTLGGLCVKVWKHWQGENVHDSSELSKEALFGGRVELFKVRNECPDVCWTDINSLYPSVMMKEFPGRLELWEKTYLPEYGVAKIVIQVPKSTLPVLPFRNDEGRILYPYGTLQGTWTIPEINAAIQRGAKIKKVIQAYGATEAIKPYGTFVSKLYEARLDSKSDAEKLFFKLLMNNFFGRLSTNGKIGRSVWQTDKNKFDGVAYGEKVMVNYQMPLAEETNWCHGAYITAYGRLELLKYMELIGTDKMIYCDTDSCIFDCPGKVIPFEVSKELGKMKLESWEKDCETIAPKVYHAGKTYKAKGVPQRLAKQFIEHGHAEFDLPYKFREAITFFDRNNAKKLSVWRNVRKEKRSGYDRKKLVDNHYYPCKVMAETLD